MMKEQPFAPVTPPSREEWAAYWNGTLPQHERQRVEAYTLQSPLGAAAFDGFSAQPKPPPAQEVPWGEPSTSTKGGNWNYLIVLLLLGFLAWSVYRYWQHKQPDRVVAQYINQLPDELAMRAGAKVPLDVIAARQAHQAGDPALALGYYRTYLAEQPDNYGVQMEAGKAALVSGAWIEAVQHYEMARFNSDIYYGSATFGLALARLEMGDLSTAQQLAEELNAAPNLSPELRQSVALLLLQLKDIAGE